MARVLLFAFVIGVTLYALIDWGLNSRKSTPGGLSRWLWLAVILIFPVIGPLGWIILRLVNQAEERGAPSAPYRPPTRTTAPDDDPEFLENWARKIQRRQKKSKPEGPQDRGRDRGRDREKDNGDEDPENGADQDPTPR